MDLARAIAEPPRTDEMIDALRRRDCESAARFMRNDLEHALFIKFPLLVLLRKSLLEHGALRVMVSGSGPTLLALFRDDPAAQAAYSRAASEFAPAVRFLLPA
jgi:4-diphosphocytidyl-2-C-methyl-D-erythritol kinase